MQLISNLQFLCYVLCTVFSSYEIQREREREVKMGGVNGEEERDKKVDREERERERRKRQKGEKGRERTDGKTVCISSQAECYIFFNNKIRYSVGLY